MSETLIRGGYVLTMDDELGAIPEGDVLIRDGQIAAVGEHVDASPGADVLDGTGRIVMPGLIDGHRHMFSGLLRGGCSDVSYTGNQGGYFEVVIRQFGGNFTPRDTYMSSRIGALESIDGGITTLHAWDHNIITPEHAAESLRAMRETGLRGRYSYGPPNDTMTLDQDGVLALREAAFPDRVDGHWETADGLWSLGVATRGVELGKPEIWEGEADFAKREQLPLTVHTMAEGHIAGLAERGTLGPSLLACHALGANDAEIEMLRESGTPVCVSTPALARSGQMGSELVRLMRAGLLICLAVDSTAGCDTNDMWAVMRITMIIQRMLFEDAGVYSTMDALRQSTIDAARSLGLGEITGSLTPGKRADVILVNTQALNLAPFTMPSTLLASCVYPSNVEAVFIDGHAVKRDFELVGVDVPATVAKANETFRALAARVPVPFE